jgi:hypothetical protein
MVRCLWGVSLFLYASRCIFSSSALPPAFEVALIKVENQWSAGRAANSPGVAESLL